MAIITGVHPLEVQAHIAMLNAIDALHSSMKNVKIDVFAVVVKDGSDYALGRSRGQDLANKYVVPNIGSSYKLVIDTHSHRGLDHILLLISCLHLMQIQSQKLC